MKTPRRHVLALALSGLAATHFTPAFAATWPERPITLVVAYPAGGDTDAMARMYAEKLSARLGQPVLVENKAGASGLIGNNFVAHAKPDGYTLLLTPSTIATAPLVVKSVGSNSYDVRRDFTPIVLTGTQPLYLIASAGGPRDLKTLVAQAKAKPGTLTYASPGTGSPMHILGEMFSRSVGIQMTHVPYRGVAPAVTDLLAGQVTFTFMTWGPVAPYAEKGKVEPIAVAETHRSPLTPNVPTFAELGVHKVELSAWQGLMGPRGLPPELVDLLNRHMNEILKMPDVAKRMETFGAVPAGGAPARLATISADEYTRVGKVIKELGIQAD